MKITLPSGVIIEGEAAEITPMLASIVDHDIETPISGGDHEDKKLSADLKRSVEYKRLGSKNRETYHAMVAEGGGIQVSLLADMLGVSASAMQGRIATLREAGLVRKVSHGIWEAL